MVLESLYMPKSRFSHVMKIEKISVDSPGRKMVRLTPTTFV